jgi:membrane protease YdiL (CAAX protease family)
MKRGWLIAVITVSVLTVICYIHNLFWYLPAYRWLHGHRPFYIAESNDKIAGVILCVLAIRLMYRFGLRGISRELGLSAPILPAIVFGLAVSLPMLIGLAITHRFTPGLEMLPVLFLTVFGPLVEEIEYRGFGVRQLQRGTGWPFWVTVWPSAVLTGLGHIDRGQDLKEMIGLFLLTGAGGLVFAWLVYRWQNLWVAVALHVFMNLWWELFSVAKSVLGGWFPFVLQGSTILLAVLVTLIRTRPKIHAAHSAAT